MTSHETPTSPEAAGNGAGAQPRREAVLVVEPDDLTRWSIRMYLGRWFDVETAESGETVAALSGDHVFAALLLSGEVPATAAEEIQQQVRRGNPNAQVIWMVTGTPDASGAAGRTVYVEKPFALARLARMLGVSDVEPAAG